MEQPKKSNEYFAKWHFLDEETGRIEDEGYVLFEDEQVKIFKAFVAKERQTFLLTNPGHEADADLWNRWMCDAWEDEAFIAECPNVFGYYEEAYIDFVELLWNT